MGQGVIVPVEEIKEWLEWAGARLLSLQISSPLPKEPHVSWPEFAQDHREAYGYTGERLRAAIPNRFEIELMDEILLLPGLIQDITRRRIVNARALVTPISNRYLYSWTKLAFMLHTSKYQVVRHHVLGLKDIQRNVSQDKVDAFIQSFTNLGSNP
jgi:hypothetical protein